MNTKVNDRAMVVGASVEEREELQLWAARCGTDAWFASSGIEAMRVFDEVEPGLVVLDTMLEDVDAERLARVFRASRPECRIAFLTNDGVEVPYYEGLEGVGRPIACNRPVDPEVVFQRERPIETIDGIPTRGVLNRSLLSGLMLTVLRHRLSGILYLGDGAQRRVIYFRAGRPVWATTRVAAETFCRFLLARGEISQIEFNWARSFQAREKIRQGEALVKIGVLSSSDVERLLKEQIGMKIIRAYRADGARYHFDRYTAGPTCPRYAFNVISLVVEALAEHAPPAPMAESVRLQLDISDPLTEELCAFLGGDVVAELRDGVSRSTLESYAGSAERASVLVRTLRSWGAFDESRLAMGA